MMEGLRVTRKRLSFVTLRRRGSMRKWIAPSSMTIRRGIVTDMKINIAKGRATFAHPLLNVPDGSTCPEA
jgi:hypothetical protein